MTQEILKLALQFANANICVLPVRSDGSKAPATSWKKYQTEKPTADELVHWFSGDATGFGVLTGAISGNLEMIEFEGKAVASGLLNEAKEIAVNSGLGEIWDVMSNGYMETTPAGGVHFLFKILDHEVPGNTKFAQRPGEDGGCLIETRGEGGFVILAPSSGSIHPSGKAWELVNGGVESIATLTWDERNALVDIFTMMDEMQSPSEIKIMAATKSNTPEPDHLSAGDDFNTNSTWDELLIPRGWSKVYVSGGVTYWRRPGKTIGLSASTGRNDADNLFVFSTSTQFPAQQPMSKWAALTFLDFANDFTLSARHLRSMGYGKQAPMPPTATLTLVGDTYQPPVPYSGADAIDSLTPLDLDAIAAAHRLKEEIASGRARRAAKKHLDHEDLAATYVAPTYVVNWAEEILLKEIETVWTVKDLFPQGANVTLTAQFKAGKTTMVNSLVKSLCDDEPFLNHFETMPHPGRVVVFNYEVGENQYRRWLKDVGIKNQDKLTMLHLRGQRMPLGVKFVEDQVVQILKDAQCETWIVDPFARAFVGGDENSNSEVGIFLDTLDVIKERAGVKNLVLPIHTGRQVEQTGNLRARGATRTDDWADVRWILKKTDDGRFFSADGRDVLIDEQRLSFDEATRGLSFGGSDAKVSRNSSLVSQWVDAVEKNPGATTGVICAALGVTAQDKAFTSARRTALLTNLVRKSAIGRADTWSIYDGAEVFQMHSGTIS